MSGLFGSAPKPPAPVPTINTSDAQNRVNNALAQRLASGGTNADQTSAAPAAVGAPRLPTLTGLN
ncbi:MAG TPA: hypothetical protein VMU59_04265 [Caulobacteraceae bacterium]|nr:hypothetical protein [Caulobacteraceae bacterium]